MMVSKVIYFPRQLVTSTDICHPKSFLTRKRNSEVTECRNSTVIPSSFVILSIEKQAESHSALHNKIADISFLCGELTF